MPLRTLTNSASPIAPGAEISVTDIVCFGEDFGHERIISSIITRVFREEGVSATLLWRVARRGHGAVVSELKSLLRDIQREAGEFPQLIVVATDANCKGYNTRRHEITDLTGRVPGLRVVCALPDPHVERWLLIDSVAFKNVLGTGCLDLERSGRDDPSLGHFLADLRPIARRWGAHVTPP